MWLSLVFFVVYLLATADFRSASAESRPPSSLDSLRAELKRIDSVLTSRRITERDLLQQMDETAQSVVLREQLIRLQQRRVEEISYRMASLETDIAVREPALSDLGVNLLALEDRHRDMAAGLARTLLAEHRITALGPSLLLLGAEDWQEWLARRMLLWRLQRAQREALQTLAATVDSTQQIEDMIFGETQLLRQHKEELERSRFEANALAGTLSEDIDELGVAKKALREQIARLRKDRSLLLRRRADVESAQRAIGAMILKTVPASRLPGVSLAGLRARLPWPVDGRIVQEFGLVRNPEFSTLTENPGIEFAVSSDAPVSAVAEGRVLSVARLRGFGSVCIVEHPGSYYTVYARLGQIIVGASDTVRTGMTLGYAGFDPASENYRIHFELWSGSTKQNPRDWLQAK